MDFSTWGLSEEADREVKECKLIQGLLAILAQSVLVLLVFGALIWKRHMERPIRPWKIWCYDVGKQGVSSLVIHLYNTAMSMAVSSTTATTSQCSWYFVVYVIDNTVGVALALLFHHAMVKYAQSRAMRRSLLPSQNDGLLSRQECNQEKERKDWWDIVAACGYYGQPPSYGWWAIQLTEWLLAVVLSRIATASIIILCKRFGLKQTAAIIDKWFTGHPGALLFTVLVFFPLVANIAQAILKDAILKSRRLLSRAFSVETQHTSFDPVSPLFTSGEDSRSEDGRSPRKRRTSHNPDAL